MAKRRKKNKVKKFLLIIISVIVICMLSFVAYSLYSLNKMSKKPSASNKNVPQSVEPVKGESVNILIVGVDMGDEKTKNEPKRTDTMLVMHYNPSNKKVNVVSIPRDTRVLRKGKYIKINSAHAINGMEGAINAVENLLGLDINYYAKLDYEGFRKVMDAIGGIDMPIERNMNYDDPGQNLSIKFKKGTIAHLDGKKAEEFFRWRKNNDGSGFAEGDIGRIRNQHLFMEKVVEKIKSPSIIIKLPKILSVIPEYVETNMSPEEIIKYGTIIATSDKGNVKFDVLKGEGKYIQKVSYFLYNEKQSKEILNALYDIDTSVLDKSKLNIQVLNCTNKVGLAANYAEYLKNRGYRNIKTGNAEKAQASNLIFCNDLSEEAKKIIKKDFKIKSEKSSKNKGEFDIIVLLGEEQDYINKK